MAPDSQQRADSPTCNIFLSHFAEEQDVALRLAQAIEEDFHGLVRVFHSSDPIALEAGQSWFDRTREQLKASALLLVLCSPQSVNRSWLHFEAGGGWALNIDVIPVCHKGLATADLRLPFALYEAVSINDAQGLSRLYLAIANVLHWPKAPALGERGLELLGVRRISRWRYVDVTLESDSDASSNAVGRPVAVAKQKPHIVYRDSEGRVHELSYDTRWRHHELARPPAAGDPAAFFFGDELRVLYRDNEGRIHEHRRDPNDWIHTVINDTDDISSKLAAATGDPFGYAFHDTQHVVYRGTDRSIHELIWRGGRWEHRNLPELGLPEPVGSLRGIGIGHRQHIVYRANDNCIYELTWHKAEGDEWRRGDMRLANTAGDPAIYDHFGCLHVIYRDLSGAIYDAWFEGGIWRRHDVTNETKPPTSPKGDPFGFGWGPSQRIDFRGKDDHIYQLSWDGSWTWSNITSSIQDRSISRAPLADSDPIGYSAGGTLHTIYRGKDSHIHDVWWS